MDCCNYIFGMSFKAGGDAGVALVSARNENDAIQILKNTGRFNATPGTYTITQIRNVGVASCICTEVLMESYTNAEGVFARLMQVIDCLKGDKGDPGDTTIVGATQSDWNQTDDSLLDYIKNKPTIPSTLAELLSDSGHRTVTDAQLSEWNAKSSFSGNYNDLTNKPSLSTVATSGSYEDLTNKPTIPAAQVNADWNATSGKAKILNKPTIPAAQVNADWNAIAGVAQILNKPTIPAAQVNSDWNASSGKAQILNKPDISKFPKYELCEDLEEYYDIQNPQSDTFYCIPEEEEPIIIVDNPAV